MEYACLTTKKQKFQGDLLQETDPFVQSQAKDCNATNHIQNSSILRAVHNLCLLY
jgi:hypothetical protein